MNFADTIQKLHAIESQLKKKYPAVAQDKEKSVLARSAKVSEEYGELVNEILLYLNLQRSEKQVSFDKKNLEKEFGDVFNALIILGLSLDFDVEKAIEKRLDEMYKRYINSTN